MITCYPKDGSIIKEAPSMTVKRSCGLYDKRKDPYRDYLKKEISINVWEQLERARVRWGAINIKPEYIDKIIDCQDISELKAIRYIKYKFLSECSYVEVFGDEAKKEYSENRANKKIAEMDDKIDLIMEALGVVVGEKNKLLQLKRA